MLIGSLGVWCSLEDEETADREQSHLHRCQQITGHCYFNEFGKESQEISKNESKNLKLKVEQGFKRNEIPFFLNTEMSDKTN